MFKKRKNHFGVETQNTYTETRNFKRETWHILADTNVSEKKNEPFGLQLDTGDFLKKATVSVGHFRIGGGRSTSDTVPIRKNVFRAFYRLFH